MRPDTLPHRGDVFQHFKGGYYLVLEVAHEVDEDVNYVVYTPLYDPHRGKVVTRRLADWMAPKDDKIRFKRVDHNVFSCCGSHWIARASNRLQILTGHSLFQECLLTREPTHG